MKTPWIEKVVSEFKYSYTPITVYYGEEFPPSSPYTFSNCIISSPTYMIILAHRYPEEELKLAKVLYGLDEEGIACGVVSTEPWDEELWAFGGPFTEEDRKTWDIVWKKIKETCSEFWIPKFPGRVKKQSGFHS